MAKTPPPTPKEEDGDVTDLLTGAAAWSAAERVRRLQQREQMLGEGLRTFWQRLIPSMRRDLEDHFYRVALGMPLTDTPAIWNFTAVRQQGIEEQLLTLFEKGIGAAEQELGELLDGELEETYEEHYWMALWGAYQEGYDVPADAEVDRPSILPLLAATAFAGITYQQRLKFWFAAAREKYRRSLHASIVGGDTLARTVQWFDGIGAFLQGRVSTLILNEVAQASQQGQDDAIGLFGADVIGEIWVTRQDPYVCAVCEMLHGTMTTLIPRIDTHPGCRCVKIPVLVGGLTPRPIDFEWFMNEVVA